MLSPEFLDSLPESVVELFRQVEQDILLDMARRISKADKITDTAAWQAWRYEQTKLVSSNALKVLAKATGKSKTELVQLFQTAALETLQSDGKIYTAAGLAIPESLSPTLQNILQSGYLQTGKAMDNFTATTANTVTKEFENALDRAWLQVNTGAFSYQQAIRRAILDLAQNGLHSVVYPSGHKDTIEVAVRRAVLTGVNQTAAKLQLARMDELGCDLVETTAHAGARPSHAVWQGKIFSRSGKSSKYPDFVSSTGYGTGAGLGGWNCRHNFYPYFEGLSKRAYTSQQLKDFEKKEISYKGKDYTRYEASQIQREMERRIRKSKREYLALDAAGLDTSQTAATLAKRRQTLKDFLNETGLRQDSFREQVAGFGRSAAARARYISNYKTNSIKNKILRGAGGKVEGQQQPIRQYLGKIDPKDTKAVSAICDSFCKKYASADVECMLVITKEGEVHFLTDNNPKGVDCSYLGDKLKDSYNIHTHPPDSTQFSFSTDIDMPNFFKDGSAVMEAVDYKYRYRFERPDGITWEQWDKVRAEVRLNIGNIMNEYNVEFDDYAENEQHIIISESCRRLGIDDYYRRNRT